MEQREYSPIPPWPRTDYCGALRAADAGREVALWGWVATRRDHGRLIFIDLRNREGIVQLVFNPDINSAAHALAESARAEFYLAIKGNVVARSAATINTELPTGAVEIVVGAAEILSASPPPPFQLGPGVEAAAEELRLKYRYLDLRRPEMQENLRRRHQALRGARAWLDAQGFIEIETPILWRATPEGARDYLVPSRVNPGKFYALPQSPQLLKQLLMVSGFDRYYQIARCFRDEDLRANRQPEFSQIDIEMTGPRVDDIVGIAEGMMASIYEYAAGIKLTPPFPRLTYAEAMARFGTDKPDLRFGLELKDFSAAFAGTSFKIFAEVLARGEAIHGMVLPAAHALSRRELDEMVEAARLKGMGLGWMRAVEAGWQGPIARHLEDAPRAALVAAGDIQPGDLILLMAGAKAKVLPVLGDLRLQLGAKFKLPDESALKFLWVVDFPMFEHDEQEQRLVAVHHPFTAPHPDDVQLLEQTPTKVRALAYDMVLNGQEMGGGSIRIHDREQQLRAFSLIGISREEAYNKFGFLLDALGYGAPPHGGIAFGVDRIAMMVCGTDSLRDVMAFPKTQKAIDPMSGAPSEVDPRQLRELSIRVAS